MKIWKIPRSHCRIISSPLGVGTRLIQKLPGFGKKNSQEISDSNMVYFFWCKRWWTYNNYLGKWMVNDCTFVVFWGTIGFRTFRKCQWISETLRVSGIFRVVNESKVADWICHFGHDPNLYPFSTDCKRYQMLRVHFFVFFLQWVWLSLIGWYCSRKQRRYS